MKKLALDLDQLAVESFETLAPASRRGTVLGNVYTDPEPALVIVAVSDTCTSDPDGGTNTCDRRCEPSIANCTGEQLIVG
ncbi:MAG TPA: hypothetical protein VFJ16_29145 [Longimicrobium sp.]|nr:hypothetical protein [Longimicrobium sp.]